MGVEIPGSIVEIDPVSMKIVMLGAPEITCFYGK
jgi:hypothetical protein